MIRTGGIAARCRMASGIAVLAVVCASPLHAQPLRLVPLPAPALAAADAAMAHAAPDRPLRGSASTGPEPSAPVSRPAIGHPAQPAEQARPDLAFYAGDRTRSAQFEVGVLGGGRSDAPALLHVGVGLDF